MISQALRMHSFRSGHSIISRLKSNNIPSWHLEPKRSVSTGPGPAPAPAPWLLERVPLAEQAKRFRQQDRSLKLQRYQSSYNYKRFNTRRPGLPAAELLRRWSMRSTFYREVAVLAAVVAGLLAYNMEQVPVSGRRRFNIIKESWEESLSQGMKEQIMQQYAQDILPEFDSRTRLVRRVLDRLIPASGLADKAWEVTVINRPDVNAFVIPGGKVFVFAGILPIAQDEDGLAAVLGHEIAHNVAHHAAERMSSSVFSLLALLLFTVATGVVPDSSYNALMNVAFEMPRSRRQESEADYIGLMMMAQSCYNPAAAAAMFGRMAKYEQSQGGTPPPFLSTHPSSHDRQAKLTEWEPKAMEKYNESSCGSTAPYMADFRTTIART